MMYFNPYEEDGVGEDRLYTYIAIAIVVLGSIGAVAFLIGAFYG